MKEKGAVACCCCCWFLDCDSSASTLLSSSVLLRSNVICCKAENLLDFLIGEAIAFEGVLRFEGDCLGGTNCQSLDEATVLAEGTLSPNCISTLGSATDVKWSLVPSLSPKNTLLCSKKKNYGSETNYIIQHTKALKTQRL
eukprot:TRINITY_DN721_c0_g2_i3.p1 TRINITY_DN721_c0_g2~~TRINITY_DN721_c0_g2_i3.p1  ORF type:complete len:141 (-),score=11.97 TRINITY_DN721_c0_g2_i3:62-484(-)